MADAANGGAYATAVEQGDDKQQLDRSDAPKRQSVAMQIVSSQHTLKRTSLLITDRPDMSMARGTVRGSGTEAEGANFPGWGSAEHQALLAATLSGVSTLMVTSSADGLKEFNHMAILGKKIFS